MENKSPIVLVAGGSGGHVFPALAFAESLQEAGYKVTLWTDPRGARFIPKDFINREGEGWDDLSSKESSEKHKALDPEKNLLEQNSSEEESPGKKIIFSFISSQEEFLSQDPKKTSKVLPPFKDKIFHEPSTSSQVSLKMAFFRFNSALKAFFTYVRDLKKNKPQFVWGFGGSFSVLPIFASGFCGIPRGIHQSDVIPGQGNRVLSPFTSVIALGCWESSKNFFFSKRRLVLTGTPVRKIFSLLSKKEHSLKDGSTDVIDPNNPRAASQDHPLKLCIIGGSQGSRIFSRVIPQATQLLTEDDQKKLMIVQQCRPEDLDQVKECYKNIQAQVELASFFPDLPQIFSQCHMVIGRAGASTLAELAIMGKPALLVPYPFAGYHQFDNGERVVEENAGWMQEEKDFDSLWLKNFLQERLNNLLGLKMFAENMKKLNLTQGGERMIVVMEKIIASQKS